MPDLLTSSNVGSTTDSQGAVNKEDLVTRGATDLIAGPNHLFYHQLDFPRKCVTQSEVDCKHQQVGGIASNEIFPLDTS